MTTARTFQQHLERASARLLMFVARRPARSGVMAVLFVALLGCASAQPRADRNWYPYLANTPHVQVSETRFAVSPVSDWEYNAAGPTAQRYRDAAFDMDKLRRVWFMLEPQPGSTLAAHTLLLFEFEGDRLLGLTVEARREQGEEYSAVWGAFNSFELSYVWASARDLLTRRAVMLDHEVFVYPVAIDGAQQGELLRRVLARTEELETRPRFYNTFFSNCTNELAKATDLEWHYSFVLTGVSDDHLFASHIIPGASFEDVHRRSDVTAFIKGLNQTPPADFDAALLAELRQRFD